MTDEALTSDNLHAAPCQTITRVFHTDNSDASHTRTSLDALAPVAVADGTYGSGLRWISSVTNGTTTVITTRDSFFGSAAAVISTDDSATTTSPDAVTVSNHGRTVSSSDYGAAHPETMAYDAACCATLPPPGPSPFTAMNSRAGSSP